MTDSTTYKKTNIPWLPEVPEHWQLLRLKNFCDYVNRGNTPDYVESSSLKVVNQATFSKGFWDEQNIRFTSESEKDFRGRLVLNDVLLASTGGGVLGKTCIFAQFEGEYIADSHVTVLRDSLNRFDPRFLYYYLSINYNLINAVLAQGSTNQTELQREWLRGMYFPYPPIPEQITISNYLDTQSEKINRFIAAKLRFIELLKEQRQSIIDENLISTGNTIKLKYCVSKVGSGVTPTGGASVYKDSGIPFLRSQNVHNDGLRLSDVAFISTQIHQEMKNSHVNKNDVLLNVTGASIGRCTVFPFEHEANVNQHVCIIRPNNEIIVSDFLMLQIQSDRIQKVIKTVEGASREGLTLQQIKNFQLVIPNIAVQLETIERIQSETATIDTAIAKAEREIELIREYREAMIAEAVTGKRKI